MHGPMIATVTADNRKKYIAVGEGFAFGHVGEGTPLLSDFFVLLMPLVLLLFSLRGSKTAAAAPENALLSTVQHSSCFNERSLPPGRRLACHHDAGIGSNNIRTNHPRWMPRT